MKEKFSLKDALFNPENVYKIGTEIQAVYPSFDTVKFSKEVLDGFPSLELKERMYHTKDMLYKYLPKEYEKAVTLLLEALPEELDTNNSDGDFGDFIYASYAEYVTAYGCNDAYVYFSLTALREITKRFSVEFAIRDFINTYTAETLAMLKECAKSENYHERRLASEGLRPKLPWAKKLTIAYDIPLQHLELLYSDKTRYVTRSVANHLNDIAKIDAPLVIETLQRWGKSGKQEAKEMAFLTEHALRTLVKQGNADALALLGYVKDPAIDIKEIQLQTVLVKVGESLAFDVTIEAKDDVLLMVDYVLYFRTKKGTLTPKVHKLKKCSMQKGEMLVLHKKHLFKPHMSTRTLYAGEHVLAVQVNGTIVYSKTFLLDVKR